MAWAPVSYSSAWKQEKMASRRRWDVIPYQKNNKTLLRTYQWGDMSRDDPSQATVSVQTGKSKRFLEKTLKEAHDQYLSEQRNGRKISFSKFWKLRPKSTKTIQHNKFQACCCEYCANLQFKLEAISSFVTRKGNGALPLGSKQNALDMTLCPKNNDHNALPCINRECLRCGVHLLRSRFEEFLNDNRDRTTRKCWCLIKEDNYTAKRWLKETVSQRRLVTKSGPFHELLSELEEEMKPFSLHLFNAAWQHQQFASLKANLASKWLLTLMDFGENPMCHYQD